MTAVYATSAPRLIRPLRASARWIAILVIFLPGFTATAHTQARVSTPQASPRAAVNVGAELEPAAVDLLVGRSAVLNVPVPISRVSLTSPEIADALVTTSQQVLIHGKTPGTISMFLWEKSGGIRRYEVVVRRDLSELDMQLRQLFAGDSISVASNGSKVVLSGTVSSKLVIDKAAEVAAGYVAKKEDIVNLLQQPEGAGTTQVMLRVRFAEVSRQALTELGASFFTGAEGYKDWVNRTTTQQFPAPIFDDGKLVFSDFLNFFLFNTKHNVGTVIRALQNRGLFQSLAEPNLIAQNGKEASFLAGGEYPYPVVQGTAGAFAVTIVFKEFGIKLNFIPTVLGGDLVHLKVRPEVSTLDFGNAVVVEGFRVPALSTRRTETELELRDGQTFAVAGLLNNTLTSSLQKVPGIGDIPVLGLLFRSKAARKEQTELVVMITPQIIRPGSPGAASSLPSMQERYLPPIQRPVPPPPPWPAPNPMPQGKGSSDASSAPPANVAGGPVPATGGTSGAASTASALSNPPVSTPSASASSSTTVPPAAVAAPAPRPPTKEERESAERARKEEVKRQAAEARLREADEKRAIEQAKIAAERAAEQKTRDDKLAREQAQRDAEASRKAEEARKQQEEVERKRGKALAEAEARLKAAQAAYLEQLNQTGSSTTGR